MNTATALMSAMWLLASPGAAGPIPEAGTCDSIASEARVMADDGAGRPGQVVFVENFESWETGRPSGWASVGDGWTVNRDAACPGEGSVSAGLGSGRSERSDFGTLARTLPAGDLRGKWIRLSALVRTDGDGQGRTGLWLRVDRPGGVAGFFDNMNDRPISSRRWNRFVIEGEVASDAERVSFGLLQANGGQAWIDDLRIETLGDAAAGPGPSREFATLPRPQDRAPAPLAPRALRNLRALAEMTGRVRFFHPTDEAAALDWDRFTISAVEAVEHAESDEDLAVALRDVFQAVAPGLAVGVAETPPAGSRAIAWRHYGLQTSFRSIYSSERIETPRGLSAPPLDLGDGVVFDLPITVWRTPDGRTWPIAQPPSARPGDAGAHSAYDRTTRLASVILAWSALGEFYPYFDVIEGDWDAALDRALQDAALDPDPRAFAETLSRLLVALEDGHARVESRWLVRRSAPVALDMIEDKVVVTGLGFGAGDLRVGDLVTAVEGVPIEARLAAEEALISGSPQWRRYTALGRVLVPRGGVETVRVAVSRADGSSVETLVQLKPAGAGPLHEPRPEPVALLEGDVLYVDLTRLDDAALEAVRTRIEAAPAVVFDLRGYPRARPWYLSRLSDQTVTSPAFELPLFKAPGQADVGWADKRWVIAPETPRIGKAVFIINSAAISFAESILGVVAMADLAPTVGSATAGANGNVNALDLPGGYRISWTGMRVRAPNGGVHHNRGIAPTTPVTRTLAGVRAGRDELLEAALALVR